MNIIAERTKKRYESQPKEIKEKLDLLSKLEISDYQFIKRKPQNLLQLICYNIRRNKYDII